jgi:neutral ceramidase
MTASNLTTMRLRGRLWERFPLLTKRATTNAVPAAGHRGPAGHRRGFFRRCAGLALCAAVLGRAAAADEGLVLRVGAAKADITPGTDVLNWVTGKPYGAVLDPLFVHALLLDDGRTRAVILRWDLVDVSESACDEVRQVVGAALAMPEGHILINASHTHSAPWAPVWQGGHRGQERDTWWALRYMPAQNEHPPFRRWMQRILDACVEAAQGAARAARPAVLKLGRVTMADYLHNRRPRAPAWGLGEPKPPAAIGPAHPDWDPEVLQGGASFGPMDRTLALLSVQDATGGGTIATVFHAACHSVSIYPFNPGISADWPGAAAHALTAALGGESLFLQGCCGDINPWRRGPAAVSEMAAGVVRKARQAAKFAVTLRPQPLRVERTTVELPLLPPAKTRTGLDRVTAEIQAIVCGPLAFVTLPGEPMTELGQAIRERSPFPQTLVLGYSNGNGVHYVGLPGEKARGGYEAGVAGAGTDECGALLVEAAVRLLRDVFGKSGYQTK